MVVNTEVLKDNPEVRQGACRHLVRDPRHDEVRRDKSKEAMAKASGTDLKGFDEQLATTELFSDPKEAVAFTTGGDLKTTTERVSKFLFEKSLLGKDAKSEGAIGVEFPDKTVFGDKGNVKFRYDATYHERGRGREALGIGAVASSTSSGRQAGQPCARSIGVRAGTLRLALALLPFLALLLAYVIGSAYPACRESQRQAAAELRAPWARRSTPMPSRPIRAPATTCCGPTRRRA